MNRVDVPSPEEVRVQNMITPPPDLRRAKKAYYNRTSDHVRARPGQPAFTAEEAASIRRRLKAFESPRAIALEYGVSAQTVLRAGRSDYIPRAA